MSKSDQIRALREARAARGKKPNQFKDVARGRDPAPSSVRNTPEASGTARKAPSAPESTGASRSTARASTPSRAKEPKAGGHNLLDEPVRDQHRGSSRLRAGRTAQDAAPPPGESRVAIQGKRPKSSDGGSRGQPFVPTDAVGKSPAPRASSGKQEGRTGSEVGAKQISGSSASCGLAKPIIAGQVSGPSEASSKRGRGRPKVTGKRPWEAEGISRRTWYRRKAGQEPKS